MTKQIHGPTKKSRLSRNSTEQPPLAISHLKRRGIQAPIAAMTMRFIEETERSLCFDVVRCRYAELYEQAGMKNLGFCLSCSRDEPFTKGFNPRMRLVRTQTIMQGSSICDFRFLLE